MHNYPRYIEELHENELRKLTRLLYLPRAHVLPSGKPSSEWLKQQEDTMFDKMKKFPQAMLRPCSKMDRLRMVITEKCGLRVKRWLPQMADLCKVHQALNPWVIHNLFELLTLEVTRRTDQIVHHNGPLWTEEVARFVDRMLGVPSLWMSEAMFKQVYDRDGSLSGEVRFMPLRNAVADNGGSGHHHHHDPRRGVSCEACVLALVGASGRLLGDLRANTRSRERVLMAGKKWERLTPVLHAVVEAWIRHLPAPERDLLYKESNALLRGLRRMRKYERERLVGLRRSDKGRMAKARGSKGLGGSGAGRSGGVATPKDDGGSTCRGVGGTAAPSPSLAMSLGSYPTTTTPTPCLEREGYEHRDGRYSQVVADSIDDEFEDCVDDTLEDGYTHLVFDELELEPEALRPLPNPRDGRPVLAEQEQQSQARQQEQEQDNHPQPRVDDYLPGDDDHDSKPQLYEWYETRSAVGARDHWKELSNERNRKKETQGIHANAGARGADAFTDPLHEHSHSYSSEGGIDGMAAGVSPRGKGMAFSSVSAVPPPLRTSSGTLGAAHSSGHGNCRDEHADDGASWVSCTVYTDDRGADDKLRPRPASDTAPPVPRIPSLYAAQLQRQQQKQQQKQQKGQAAAEASSHPARDSVDKSLQAPASGPGSGFSAAASSSIYSIDDGSPRQARTAPEPGTPTRTNPAAACHAPRPTSGFVDREGTASAARLTGHPFSRGAFAPAASSSPSLSSARRRPPREEQRERVRMGPPPSVAYSSDYGDDGGSAIMPEDSVSCVWDRKCRAAAGEAPAPAPAPDRRRCVDNFHKVRAKAMRMPMGVGVLG